jgi:hypothetical protein
MSGMADGRGQMRLARTIVACGLLALVGLFCAGSTSWAEQPRVVVRIGVQPNILPDVILRAKDLSKANMVTATISVD